MFGWIIALVLGGLTLIGFDLWGRRRSRGEKPRSNKLDITGTIVRRFIRPRSAKVVKKQPASAAIQAILYDVYVISAREKALVILFSGVMAGALGFVFYKSFVFSAVITSTGLFAPRFWRKAMIRRRKGKLLIQFRQALHCIASSLTAGKSAENAFRDALGDLKLLYIDQNSLIVREFASIVQRLDNGEPLEQAVADFARRANEEDIGNFVDVLITCKRTGGNLIEVMRRTAAIIGEKLEIQAEIAVLLAQKKFESNVLTVAPVLIIALLSLTSADYMEPMFQGFGRIIMSASLGILGACFWYTQRLMRIAV